MTGQKPPAASGFSTVRRSSAAALLALSALTSMSAVAQDLYFECPCRFSSDGETFTVTAGFRSHAGWDSNRLRIRVHELSSDGRLAEGTAHLADILEARSHIPTRTYEIHFERDPRHLHGEHEVAVELSMRSTTVNQDG